MRTRRSHKNQGRIWRYMTPPTAPKPEPTVLLDYLNLTDEEIDQKYTRLGKADRTRMKREAQRHRERAMVARVLAAEENVTHDDNKRW